jgi:CheY-like chemotaxis protein
MRVLLVEDSRRLQATVGAALRRSGFAVDVAGDGEEGLWRAESHDYACGASKDQRDFGLLWSGSFHHPNRLDD